MFKEYQIEKVFMGRLKKDEDLFLGLSKFLEEHGIKSGKIEGIGAVSEGKVGYYDQFKKKYCEINIPEPMEVLSLLGNVSLKEGKAFPHCHIIFGNSKGDVKGGHLLEGCKVFAFEFVVTEFDGAALVRGFDEETKLPLWN